MGKKANPNKQNYWQESVPQQTLLMAKGHISFFCDSGD
jgi:hypothetical protein